MSEKPMGTRVAVWQRVSTKEQDVERQTEPIQRWLGKWGLTATYTFKVAGLKRDEASKEGTDFQRLMKLVEADMLDIIITDADDRVSGLHHFEKGEYFNRLIKHGVQLWSVKDGHLNDPENLAAAFVGVANAVTSRKELEDKSYRILTGKIREARNGRYPGGHIPYGFDVLMYDGGGQEKFRIFQAEPGAKCKVYRDGKKEPYGGGGYETNDYSEYVNTIATEREQVVLNIFTWYANGGLCENQIASRLNVLKVKPQASRRWHARCIAQMLRNPIYIGRPAYNKQSGGKYYRKDGADIRKSVWHRNKKEARRFTSEAEYVYPEVDIGLKALVPLDLWNKVQEMLKAKGSRKNAPRSAELWLKQFLFCGRCGKEMRGWAPKEGYSRGHTEYFCASYKDGLFDPSANPKGCKRHPVDARLIEAIVSRYLEETGRKVKDLLQTDEKSLLRPMLEEMDGMDAELRDAYRCMKAFILFNAKGQIDPEKLGVEGESEPVSALYQLYYEQSKTRITQAIANKKAEFEKKLDAYADLPASARERANNRLEALDREIKQLEAELENQANMAEKILSDLCRMDEAIDEAKASMAGDEKRHKAEQVGKVIDRIVCHFRHTNGRGRQPSSVLERVTIYPITDDRPKTYDAKSDLFGAMWVAPPPHEKQGVSPNERSPGRNRYSEDARKRHHLGSLLPRG